MSESKKKKVAEQQEEVKEEAAKATEETTEEDDGKEEVKEEKNEWQDKYIRLCADFENFKKRTAKETLASYGNGKIAAVEALLPVIDNFDRACDAAADDDSQLAQGVKMILKQLYEALDKLGVKPIEAVGNKFDPNFHNAVMHVEDDELDENVVVEEFQKGYICGDRVVRPSMVKVAN